MTNTHDRCVADTLSVTLHHMMQWCRSRVRQEGIAYSFRSIETNSFKPNDSFLIKKISEEKSSHRTFEELYSIIDSQKDQTPSLIKGGFTSTEDDSSLSSNMELRKFCLEKAIEYSI